MMSKRVSPRMAQGVMYIIALLAAGGTLSGCSSFGSAFPDKTVTHSAGTQAGQNLSQPMPGRVQVAANGKYLPPANIGTNNAPASGPMMTPMPGASVPGVTSSDLPSLSSTSAPAMGSSQTMPAQANVKPVETFAGKAPVSTANGYTHIIESGESLYSIARKYNVTTDALVRANNLSSPDKIVVGQKIIVPGVKGAPQVATTNVTPLPGAAQPVTQPVQQVASAAPVTQPLAAPVMQAPAKADPVQVASAPAKTQPAAPASDGKFRWPLSGKVITDFAGSKGTGINIAANEGAAVRAAETGTVIYVGNAVEGYGNLILIKHENGYVSAYAHLSQASISKGDAVNRGDVIGLAGKTGSVTTPQLHFELRKGATPVDPVPMLAG